MSGSNKDLQETLKNISDINKIDFNSAEERAFEMAMNYIDPSNESKIKARKDFQDDVRKIFQYDKQGKIIKPSYEFIGNLVDNLKLTTADFYNLYNKALNDFYNSGLVSRKQLLDFLSVEESYLEDIAVVQKQKGLNVDKSNFNLLWKTFNDMYGELTQEESIDFVHISGDYAFKETGTKPNPPPKANGDESGDPGNPNDWGYIWQGMMSEITHPFGTISHFLEGDIDQYINDLQDPNSKQSKSFLGLGELTQSVIDNLKDVLGQVKTGLGDVTGVNMDLVIYGAIGLGALIIYNQIRPLIKNSSE
jgi:hypothetical protein